MIEKPNNETAWGVEFGGSAVRAVRLARTDAGYRVQEHFQVDLPQRWEGPPDLAAAAGRLGGARPAEPLAACLPDELVLCRSLSMPAADPAATAKMVAGQLEALIPAQADRFATVWRSDEDLLRKDAQRVLMLAVRREALDGVVAACRRLGPGPRIATPSVLALATAWSRLGRNADPPTVLLDVGARCTALAVVHEGRVVRCGVLDQGADHWVERLADQLEVPPAQAERRKLEYTAQPASASADPAVHGCIQQAVAEWSRQLRETYQDCVEEIPRPLRPRRCVLFGRASRTPFVAAAVVASLNLEVLQATPPDRLALPAGADFDSLAPAIGAALCVLEADAATVNLVQAAAGKRRLAIPSARRWAALVLWLLVAVLALYCLDRGEAARLTGVLDEIREKTGKHGGLDRDLAVGAYLESAAPPPLVMLDRISAAAPEKAMLLGFQYNTTGELTLEGTVPSEQECMAMLQKLGALGTANLRSGRPVADKFRFEIHLKAAAGMRPSAATQPAATQPAGGQTSPASRPAGTQPAVGQPGPPGRPPGPAEPKGPVPGSADVEGPAGPPASGGGPLPVPGAGPAPMPMSPPKPPVFDGGQSGAETQTMPSGEASDGESEGDASDGESSGEVWDTVTLEDAQIEMTIEPVSSGGVPGDKP